MYSDYHVHTEYSFDSETPIREQINQAIQLSMERICITDHHDYDAPATMAPMLLDTKAYMKSMEQIKKEFIGQIKVFGGVELGLQPHLKEYLKEYSQSWDFDFIIGSCHLVDEYDPYYPEYYEVFGEARGYEKYFEHSLENARQHTCYDVLGHLDYVIRYGPNKNKFFSYLKYKELIDEILKEIIKNGKGIEINTGGLKYGLGHTNPHEDIIKRYLELGGEILTLGSDGHTTSQLGYDFQKLPAILNSCGVRYYTVFENRKPIFVPIS